MAHKGLPALAPGALFRARYRIVRLIKAGGQGAVYEVKDETTNRPRALKVMLPSLVDDPDMRARFELEARVTGDIESDHLVRISDVGIDDASGAPFMVMDLLRGEDLQSVLARRGALPPAEVLDCLAQTSRVLDKTHAANIVHRDLKPDNLFVTSRDDGSPCIKILDFGIAKVIAQANAKKTRALGTPLYMAPEQVRGDPQIGSRVDVLALAHVSYTLLTGSAYWAEEAQADPSLVGLLMKIMGGVQESPVARAFRRHGLRLPDEYEGWFRKATATSPAERFETAGALITALSPIIAKMQAPAQPVVNAAAPAMPTGSVGQAHTGQTWAGPTHLAPGGQTHTGQTWAQPTHLAPAGAPGGQTSTGQTWAAPTQAAPAASMPQGPAYGTHAGVSPTGPYPGQTYAPAMTGPGPGMGYPAAPVAAPAPKSSTPLLPILGAIGGLGLLVLILIVVLVARSGGGSSAPMPAPMPAGACGAAAACMATPVKDAKHVDAIELLAVAKKLANQADSTAKFLGMTLTYTQRDGSSDLTGNKSMTYLFTTAKNDWVTIFVQEKLASAVVSAATTNYTSPVPDPRCSPKQVVDAAVKGGFAFQSTATLYYSYDLAVNEARWMVYDAAGSTTYVDDKNCK